MAKYKIAGVVFEFNAKTKGAQKMLDEYVYSGDKPACFTFCATEDDIAHERVGLIDSPSWYLESLALFRKLCEYVIDNHNGIIFHASTIAIEGKAYLFTAPSGTGKSTHVAMLREKLKERAFMINDDKPLIRYEDGEFYAYGTPWNGKHRLSTNCRVKIEGICKLYRADSNMIRKAEKKEMMVTILNQTLRFSDETRTDKLLFLIDKMLSEVKIYALGCNMDKEAAEVSYNGMVKGEVYEN